MRLDRVVLHCSIIVPLVGMLCGNTVSAVVVAVAFVLKELSYVFCPSLVQHLMGPHLSARTAIKSKLISHLVLPASRHACQLPVRRSV